MAEAMIQQTWPDGSTLTVSVDVEESFPDAVAECEASLKRLWAKALNLTLAGTDDDDDEDVL